MKGSVTDFNNLDQNVSVSTTTDLVLEANMNRYFDLDLDSPEMDSTLLYGNDTTVHEYYESRFPVKSIAGHIRPKRPGAAFARNISSASLLSGKRPNMVSVSQFNDLSYSTEDLGGSHRRLNKRRLMYPGPHINYQYFARPQTRSSTGAWSTFATRLVYENAFWCNKIVITFENTYGDAGDVQVSTWNGSAWSVIGTFAAPSSGRLVVWRGVSGTWTTTYNSNMIGVTNGQLDSASRIQGVRIVCSAPTGPMGLVELSPRLAASFSGSVIDWSWDANISEGDSLHPVGTVSANSGNITIDDSELGFDPSTRSSINCRASELCRNDVVATGRVSISGQPWIDQFEAYVESWEGDDVNTFSSPIRDRAFFAQQTDCPAMVLENATPTQVIWRLLELAGFGAATVKHLFVGGVAEREPILPIFYSNEEDTLWDTIQALCQDFKYSVYVDESGDFVIATRAYLMQNNLSPVWTFRSDLSGGSLANIESFSSSNGDPVNKVSISFTSMGRESTTADTGSKLKKGSIANMKKSTRILYTPERAVTLGYARIIDNFGATATQMRISSAAFVDGNWGRFSGHILVDQEIIKYDGTQFSYKDSTTGSLVYETITDTEHFNEVKSRADGNVTFTGRLMGLERGQFGTKAVAHNKTTQDWRAPNGQGYRVKRVEVKDAKTGAETSYLQIKGYTGQRTTAYKNLSKSYSNYFAEVRIPWTPGTVSEAGVVIWPQVNGDRFVTGGIWITLNPTGSADAASVAEVKVHRTSAFSYVSGSEQTFQASVRYDKPVKLNLRKLRQDNPSKTRWGIYVNDRKVGHYEVWNSWFASKTGMALFARDASVARFDYAGGANVTLADESDYVYDLKQMLHSILMNYSGKTMKPSDIEVDRFDDVAREIFYEDVDFTVGPALDVKMSEVAYSSKIEKVFIERSGVTSTLFVANQRDVVGAISDITPWSAKVFIANISDKPVILTPESSSNYPQLYGPVIERSEQLNVEEEEEERIRREGEKKFETTLKWVNRRKSVEKLAKEILDDCKNGTTRVQVEAFSNVLLSLGDPVSIIYPEKGYNGSERFIVTGVSASGPGASTSIELVRQRD
jgi:hypothetical protein